MEFGEWTPEGRLRHPSWRGLRSRYRRAGGACVTDWLTASSGRCRPVGTCSCPTSDKVLYPDIGFTKGQVIDYYARIADVLLPHLADRPLTVKRYPDGVDGKFFFEKNAPSHAAGLGAVSVELPTPGSTRRQRDRIRYVVVDDLPVLIWLANLAALELHVPQWTVGPRGGRYAGRI
ncbi:MAG: hypothetical protein WKG07_08750 [Hymenobacter sp.]